MTKDTSEYLVVGSIPNLVEAFMKSHDLTPVTQLDETTFIVTGDASYKTQGIMDRFTMVANLYLKEEAAERADSIPGLRDDETRLAVKNWAGSLKK